MTSKQVRFLVVEDEPVSRAVLTRILSAFGECDAVADGEEALTHVANSYADKLPYDLILLDISLPGTDGQEVLNRIRDMEEDLNLAPEKGVKVIITTGHDDEETIFAAHVSGCHAYLVKPISKNQIMTELANLGLVDGARLETPEPRR